MIYSKRDEIKPEDIKVGDIYVQTFDETTIVKICTKRCYDEKGELEIWGNYIYVKSPNKDRWIIGMSGFVRTSNIIKHNVKFYKPSNQLLNKLIVEDI